MGNPDGSDFGSLELDDADEQEEANAKLSAAPVSEASAMLTPYADTNSLRLARFKKMA